MNDKELKKWREEKESFFKLLEDNGIPKSREDAIKLTFGPVLGGISLVISLYFNPEDWNYFPRITAKIEGEHIDKNQPYLWISEYYVVEDGGYVSPFGRAYYDKGRSKEKMMEDSKQFISRLSELKSLNIHSSKEVIQMTLDRWFEAVCNETNFKVSRLK